MKEGFLPGGNIYYRTNSIAAGRKNLVFIHGLSGSSSAWKEFEDRFDSAYNIFALDLRGHGKSWKPRSYEEYEIQHFAEDVHDIVEYFGITKPILVSHSFGTLVVLEYLRKYQGSVGAAVLLSPSGYAGEGVIPKILKPLLSLSRRLGMFRASGERGSHIDYKMHPQKGDWDLRAVAEDVKNTSMRAYLYATEQSLRPDYRAFLKEIKVPVLLVQGRRDGIFPVKNSLRMNGEIENSRIVIIEGADHIIVKNNFREVSDAIDEFVEAVRITGPISADSREAFAV